MRVFFLTMVSIAATYYSKSFKIKKHASDIQMEKYNFEIRDSELCDTALIYINAVFIFFISVNLL